MAKLPGKVTLITGASSGIGRASALALNAAGFTVYATARKLESIQALEAEGCHILQLDVSDETSRLTAVQSIETKHGAIDLLINNAGYGEMGAIEEVGLEQWRKQYETNVFGPIRLIQLVLPAMRNKGSGRIINVSSGGGEFTFPLGGAYHASKYSVEAISDALRFEIKPFGLDVVVIQPGIVKTPLAEATLQMLQPSPDSPYTFLIANFERIGREGYEKGTGYLSPQHVAKVILKASQANRPKTRYKIGSTAHLMPFLRRLLPDRTWDSIIGRMVGA